MSVDISQPDPSWPVAIRSRQAVLWLGSEASALTAAGTLPDLFALPWAAVFADVPPDALGTSWLNLEPRRDGLVVRPYPDAAPAEPPPQNRLPVYILRGSHRQGGPGDSSDPERLLQRYEKLKRAPANVRLVFAVGCTQDEDVQALREAARLAPAFHNIILHNPGVLDVSTLGDAVERLFTWRAPIAAIRSLLPAVLDTTERVRVLVARPTEGLVSVDVTEAIDTSAPITESFDFVTADDALGGTELSQDSIRAFFDDPTCSWAAYRAGLPEPRHKEYLHTITRSLKAFANESGGASYTAWLRAEDGSGATTALRYLAFDLAKSGVPVLVAKHLTQHFDFKRLAVFLTHATDRIAVEDRDAATTPWVLAFDAHHTQTQWDFLTGLCNGLKKLQRPVVVIAVRPLEPGVSSHRLQALGDNRSLGSPLLNSVSVAAGVGLGEHLARFIPSIAARTRRDWETFIQRTLLPSQAARRSLFWLALRFWLFDTPGTGESFRSWLSRKLRETVQADQAMLGALLETAVLGRYRLSTPLALLTPSGRAALRRIAGRPNNVLGICEIPVGQQLHITFAHPLIAEEILRIASNDSLSLQAVDKPTCMSVFDLELHLFSRLVARPEAGLPSCVSVMEEIATSALRVDPRVAPRNYEHRDRIVALLEQAPATVWDHSQLYNHHVAIARRHLATDPPSADWDADARREQLDLAETHLLDALGAAATAGRDARESPLNLRVSLALTYDARARLEQHAANETAGEAFRKRAAEQYEIAQKLDAENLYVLENFARFKLRRAESATDDSSRIQLVIDAIALLELERTVDSGANRDEPVVQELGRAYELLEHGKGHTWLTSLASQGNESARVALARLLLGRESETATTQMLESAERELRSVPPDHVTWRSRTLLYRVVSLLRPYAFGDRLDLLREIRADQSYSWPMQLRLEYAILLYQVGDATYREEGSDEFGWIRAHLRERSGSMAVPRDLRFLGDATRGFLEPLRTSITVRDLTGRGTEFGVPYGWGSLKVAFRPQMFPVDRIRPGRELDCFIQFTNFGPQAVPLGTRTD